MRTLTSLIVLLGLLGAGPLALARGSEPVVEYLDMPVRTGGGRTPGAEQVCTAIAAAVDRTRAEGKYPWARVTPMPDGMVAALQVRIKHTIRVDIRCGADKYSVTYKDSVNMNYERKKKGAVIHPYYNRWVRELVDAINAELAKP